MNSRLSAGTQVTARKNPVFNATPTTSQADRTVHKEQVISSWVDALTIRKEKLDHKGNISRPGFRTPQIKALFDLQGHWLASREAGTVVMPTGTGKTEVMLSLMILQQIRRLLVIVPSDSLRKQIGSKFAKLGVLKACELIPEETLHPVVCQFEHGLKDQTDVDSLWNECHVVVATMSALNACPEVVRHYLAEQCEYVFIDEAHHCPANTWQYFRNRCRNSLLLQFTATPFREDGKRLEGKFLSVFPMKQAQEEGYFKPIDLHGVYEYDQEAIDKAIAEQAVAKLTTDLTQYDHVLMARVDTIDRAKEVVAYYEIYPEYNPQIVHSKLSKKEQKDVLNKLLSRQCRIIVCVNMLGEGFDLPNLKIAALHDYHKSWTVLLQFIGRFTRTQPNIGNASVFINLASPRVQKSMKELFQPKSDWNGVLRRHSQRRVEKEEKARLCFEGFEESNYPFSFDDVLPKASVTIYQLLPGLTWDPANYAKGFVKGQHQVEPCLNSELNILTLCVEDKHKPDWTPSKALQNIIHDLYVVWYDPEFRLLFIHSSHKSSLHEKLARALGGPDVQKVQGDMVFRCFDGIYQLRLINVGLSDAFSGQIRYTMHAGSDIKDALTGAMTANKKKANLFGTGYRDGEFFTVGGSYKGRIWSRLVLDLSEFLDWCTWVKSKITDNSINTQTILANVWQPERLEKFPDKIPICIEWPDEFYRDVADDLRFMVDDKLYDWTAVGLNLQAVTDDTILFTLSVEDVFTSQLEFTIQSGKAKYVTKIGPIVEVKQGRTILPAEVYFLDNPLVVRFADTSFLNNELYYCPPTVADMQFEKSAIEVWNWIGVDRTKESQGKTRRPDSIQRRVIEILQADSSYRIIFDDDNSGEAADVIAIRELSGIISVELYHLKFGKHKDKGGRRVEDLYAVCGQAQRSGSWKKPKANLLEHMRRRERKRTDVGNNSRFEKGGLLDLQRIEQLLEDHRLELRVFAVQPGLSVSKVTEEQLKLLGATQTYLMEAYRIPFTLIADH
ncbi:hypothetical protein BH09BAC4_BH09BAC4_21150 [soil metagenome]